MRSRASTCLGSLLSLLGACAPDRPASEPSAPPAVAAVEGAGAACPWRSLDDVLTESPEQTLASLAILEPAAWAEDLACLRRAFEHQYVATTYYREQGIDLLARLDALAIELDGPVEPRALLERLIALHEGAFDRHVGYYLDWSEGGQVQSASGVQPYLWPHRLAGTFTAVEGGYQSDDDPSLVLRACEGLEPVEAIVDAQGRRALVLTGQLATAAGLPPRDVTCRRLDGTTLVLEAATIASTGGPGEGALSYERQGDHLYVRIPVMDAERREAEQELLALVRAKDGPSTILLDLRNNPGGDDELAYRLSAALRTTDQAIPAAKATDLVSLHALAASVSLARIYDMGEAEAKYRARLRELQAAGRGFTDPPTLEAEAEALTDDLPQHGERDEPYRGRVGLLVNKACASSCESMIELLADLDQVEVLGTHTFGAVAFGNIGVSVLPRSRIQFVGGWRYFGHMDVEGVGYAPDVYVIAEDPLAAATYHLRRER